jgi:hypothetical protein
MDHSISMKSLMRRIAIPGAFVGLLAAAALAISAGTAGAVGDGKPDKANWVCIPAPPVTDELHCAHPGGLERFLSLEAKTMTLRVFDATGEVYLGTEFNIRGDLFHNPDRPCPTDPPTYKYTYLGDIFPGLDYWACHRFDSDHL